MLTALILAATLSRIDLTIPLPSWLTKIPITRCHRVTFVRFRSDDLRTVYHCGQAYVVSGDRPLEIVPECGMWNRKDLRFAVDSTDTAMDLSDEPVDSWGAIRVDLTRRALPQVRRRKIPE